MKANPKYHQMFLSVARDAVIVRNMNLYLREAETPVNIAVDGPPGSGKTTFSKRLANFLNLNFEGVFFASVVKMDDFFSGANHQLAPHEMMGMDPERTEKPEFWYRFDHIEENLRRIRALRPGGSSLISPLYNGGMFDGYDFICFPEGMITVYILEGVYSLHNRLTEHIDLGVFFWKSESSRDAQYAIRSLMRQRDPATVNAIYALSRKCYLKYLAQGLDRHLINWGIFQPSAKDPLAPEPDPKCFHANEKNRPRIVRLAGRELKSGRDWVWKIGSENNRE